MHSHVRKVSFIASNEYSYIRFRWPGVGDIFAKRGRPKIPGSIQGEKIESVNLIL